MTPANLLRALHSLGIVLTAYTDGTIRYKAPRGVLTDAMREAIRTHKEGLRDLVERDTARAARLESVGKLPCEGVEAPTWRAPATPATQDGPAHQDQERAPGTVHGPSAPAVGRALPPCAVCKGTDRWHDQGIRRCVACWPPGSMPLAATMETVLACRRCGSLAPPVGGTPYEDGSVLLRCPDCQRPRAIIPATQHVVFGHFIETVAELPGLSSPCTMK